jgi:hypothetical protein
MAQKLRYQIPDSCVLKNKRRQRMRYLYLFFGLAVFIFIGITAQAQDVTPPVISNVGVDPNPFTPNGDNINDKTIFSFTLSEPCTIIIAVDDTTDTILNAYYDISFVEYEWDGGGKPEGEHDFIIFPEDTAGNMGDSRDGVVIIDLGPPIIYDISAGPSPFSPNDDGITDYFFLDFKLDKTHPDNYDPRMAPVTHFETLHVVIDSLGVVNFWTTIAQPAPPFDYYFFIENKQVFTADCNISFFGGSEVITIPENTRINARVGGYLDRVEGGFYPGVSGVTGGGPGDNVDILFYAFAGNLNVTIDGPGGPYFPVDFEPVYRGDSGPRYELQFGGTLPDGRYRWNINVEDEAFLVGSESGTFVADSNPLKLTNLQALPDKISPADSNGLFDASNITYAISEPALVTMRIHTGSPFDTTTDVRTLLQDVPQDSGGQSVIFDGRDDMGSFLSPGAENTYFYVITAFDTVAQRQEVGFGQIRVDNIGPGAPVLDTLLSPTNQPTVDVTGNGDQNTLVTLFQNNQPLSTLTSDSLTGNFSFDNVTLEEGLNEFFAISKDDVANFGDTSNVVSVVLDARSPKLVETFPADNQSINTDPFTQVYVVAKDDETGVNLSASTVTVKKGGTTRPGITTFGIGPPDTLYYTFNQPLQAGDDEIYTIKFVLRDSVGNVFTDSTTFLYDSQDPTATVIIPPDGDTVNSLLSVDAKITDNLSGADLSTSKIILIKTPSDTIGGDMSIIDDSTFSFIPNPPLSTNGSDDRRFSVVVAAFDLAGNSDTIQTTLLYDSRPPQLISTYPDTNSYVSTPITEVWAVVTDSVTSIEVSGMDFNSSKIEVGALNGNKVIRGDTLVLVLTDTLDVDGEYTMDITLHDNVGNDTTYQTIFTLDTQSPFVREAVPADGAFVDATVPVTEVQAIFGDNSGSGINFDPSVTFITFFSPWPDTLSGTLSNDGDSILTFTLANPLRDNGTDDGRYTLVIWGEDNIGQPLAPSNPDTTTFVFDTQPPSVDSTNPAGGAVSVVLQDSVVAFVSDLFSGVNDVSGIDFAASWIYLEDPNGIGVPGRYKPINLGDTMGVLVWEFNAGVELPNGTYTMFVYLEDRAGNFDDKQITFEGGALLPEVVGFIPPQGSILNFVDRVSAIFLDNSTSGIDTIRSTLTLKDSLGTIIPVVSRFWSGDTLTLFVDTLAQDGSLDGTFIMTAQPFSNDTLIPPGVPKQSTFIYDTQAPVVIAYNPATGDTVGTPPSIVTATVGDTLMILSGFGSKHEIRIGADFRNNRNTVLSSIPGTGIDFAASTIGLNGPSGPVSGTPGDDGINTLEFRNPVFLEDGIFTITVELYDFAGNVLFDSSAFFLNAGLQLKPSLPSVIRLLRFPWIHRG